MYKLLCCRSRNIRKIEADEITDSLERCLAVERGIEEFRTFLRLNRFEEHLKTLEFILDCQSLIIKISHLSPYTRANNLPVDIVRRINRLRDTANDLNFDMNQLNTLNEYAEHNDVEKKTEFLELGKKWAVDLLRDIYNVFRRDKLRTV